MNIKGKLKKLEVTLSICDNCEYKSQGYNIENPEERSGL
jgi:hypothetical protein